MTRGKTDIGGGELRCPLVPKAPEGPSHAATSCGVSVTWHCGGPREPWAASPQTELSSPRSSRHYAEEVTVGGFWVSPENRSGRGQAQEDEDREEAERRPWSPSHLGPHPDRPPELHRQNGDACSSPVIEDPVRGQQRACLQMRVFHQLLLDG